MGNHRCTDHLGNEYSSIKDMCERHGVRSYNYYSRSVSHPEWPTEWLLFGEPEKFVDHQGNSFPTAKAMCGYHAVSYQGYTARSRAHPDLSVEERLFGNSYTTTDHLGNTFSSEREMCDKYGVKYHAYAGRKNKHPEHSLEQWLFGVPKSLLTDHLGNSFTSLAKKCSFHGIAPSVYSYRKEAHPDWDEKTLLTPSETVGKNEILLSLYAEARDSDDITADLVKSRYAAGWSADEIMGRSGRGMARKIITGLQPNILLVAISYHTYKNKKSINVPLMLCGSQPHFIVKIRATEKYSIMNADEILAFDGTEPELVFDTYI